MFFFLLQIAYKTSFPFFETAIERYNPNKVLFIFAGVLDSRSFNTFCSINLKYSSPSFSPPSARLSARSSSRRGLWAGACSLGGWPASGPPCASRSRARHVPLHRFAALPLRVPAGPAPPWLLRGLAMPLVSARCLGRMLWAIVPGAAGPRCRGSGHPRCRSCCGWLRC